jgi:hypothetical protein
MPKRIWSYLDAMNQIHLVKPMLGDLRVNYIQVNRCQLVLKKQQYSEGDLAFLEHKRHHSGNLCKHIAKDLSRMGIIIYAYPWRGIALFPCKLLCIDGKTETVERAMFIYKDSSDTIHQYVLKDQCDDLIHAKEIPEDWKHDRNLIRTTKEQLYA